jgi:hypothetical protein
MYAHLKSRKIVRIIDRYKGESEENPRTANKTTVEKSPERDLY